MHSTVAGALTRAMCAAAYIRFDRIYTLGKILLEIHFCVYNLHENDKNVAIYKINTVRS